MKYRPSTHFIILLLAFCYCSQVLAGPNKFIFSVKNFPRPDKERTGGEDAFFVDPNLLVVADGVGGWDQYGISSAEYSRRLCSAISDIILEGDEDSVIQDPKALLFETWRRDKAQASSTLMIVTLDKA